MATSKPPRFPHPPLEIGVPQYPTPNVPDFYTKDGHIILVEKQSVEKGSYNPQPLDGSITYAKRDANKWPSTLYLVHQKPTEDGEHVYNYWANDRTLASQQPWNYNITYSEEATGYPVYTRQYVVPRSQYDAGDFTGTDPVFGGATLTKLQMQELPEDNPLRSRYVIVQAVYEPIPGPLLTGYQYDPDLNEVITTTKQVVAAGETALSTTNGVISYKDEPVDANKSVRIISSISALPASRTEYKTGSFSSPNLLTGINTSVFNFSDGQIRYNVTPVMRAKRSYQTVYKYVRTYSYGQPTPSPTLFDPIAINVYYDGFFFQVNIPDCLTDPNISIRFFTGIGTPAAAYYGILDETYHVPTSDTTASQYLALVNSFQRVAYEVDYWKANIWVTTETFVLIK